MSLREIFNTFFAMGYDYEYYKTRSERQKPRMELALKIAEEEIRKIDQSTLKGINIPMKILIISENWCSDCANGTPTLARIAKDMDQWELRIVGKDDIKDLSLLEPYTTAGRSKIPIVIFADMDGDEVIRWIERPSLIYSQIADLQLRRLPKEEYIKEYKSIVKTEKIVKEIFNELFGKAKHTASLLQILPKKK